MFRSTPSQDVAPDVPNSAQGSDATEMQHLAGIKLYSILTGVSIASFLISLDASVIATVSLQFLFTGYPKIYQRA
jgi:hypothetical protein